MSSNRDLAHVESAQAYQLGEYLVLRIAGHKPTPCHVVDLEQSLIDVEPPQFVATSTVDPLALCARVIAPYELAEAFQIGSAREHVTLHHAEGQMDVPVEQLTQTSPAAAPDPAAEPAVISIGDIVGPPSEAVGYSESYDLGEAVQRAIANLPRRGQDIPDWLSTYTVVEIGAEVGGIAGWDRMFARVRG
ncbi:MAG: hypothetical protein M3340_04550 [Actinomycetota bacterium]|nr:hypothetical protein [Actinomycetota bacterium]